MSQSSDIRRSSLVVLVFFALGAGSPSVPPDLKALYDQKKYQKVVDGLLQAESGRRRHRRRCAD